MMAESNQYNSQNILDIIEKFEEEQDRMGYWADIGLLLTYINQMSNSWASTLKMPVMKHMPKEEMKERFIFLRDSCINMVHETERFYKSLVPTPPDKIKEEPAINLNVI